MIFLLLFIHENNIFFSSFCCVFFALSSLTHFRLLCCWQKINFELRQDAEIKKSIKINARHRLNCGFFHMPSHTHLRPRLDEWRSTSTRQPYTCCFESCDLLHRFRNVLLPSTPLFFFGKAVKNSVTPSITQTFNPFFRHVNKCMLGSVTNFSPPLFLHLV